jgi:hypothetical protein
MRSRLSFVIGGAGFVFLAAVGYGGGVRPAQAASYSNSGAVLPQAMRSGENVNDQTQRDPFRKECLSMHSSSHAHVINPQVFDHMISATNSCFRVIKLRVCYFKTEHCIDMTVPSQQRKDAILGSYPALQMFRYTYVEVH